MDCIFLMIRRPPRSPLFPYPTLFRAGPSTPSDKEQPPMASRARTAAAAIFASTLAAAAVVAGPAQAATPSSAVTARSEEHTSELQSRQYLVCRLLLEKKNKTLSVVRF